MRIAGVFITIGATVVLAAPPATAAPASTAREVAASTTKPGVAYSGVAYGSQVNLLNGKVTSGATAKASVGCTRQGGLSSTGSIAGISIPVVGKTGAVTTLARTTETSTYKRTNTQSQVGKVNLLGGRITADAIKTNSSAYAKSDGTRSGVNTMTFTNLKIGGRSISANVAKNSKITIAGVADVTVNQQSRTKSSTGAYTAKTTGLIIKVLPGNPLGLATGSTIQIASATAAVQDLPDNLFYSGTGFSTRVRALNGAVTSSPTALQNLPCGGGTRTTDVAAVNIPLLASSGTTTTTAVGKTDTSRTYSRVTNTTASPRVLGGLISADAIKAETTTSRSRSTGQFYRSNTSTFAGLKIGGKSVASANLKPNSVVNVPGVARVTINKQVTGTKSITVTMLHVELLQGVAGLPTGSVVEVGYSSTGLK
ncbi:choice-of-anchor P family protein [Janibacter sp. UYMM211]|uniref:choice-of-anchor P family protein n=1 Tax=Janibacter sp. UYMM211 TaxID=3156342 RepID=UPI003392D75D